MGTFAGTHSNTFVEGGVLRLSGGADALFDDIPDFDSIASLDGYGGIEATGTYTFANSIDLGSVKNVRVTTSVTAVVVAANDLIDERTDNIDDWADFDGAAGDEADCYIELSESDDNVTYEDYGRVEVGEFRCRYLRGRAILETDDPAYNIQVSALSVTVDEVT
jgi:hypothetical protein